MRRLERRTTFLQRSGIGFVEVQYPEEAGFARQNEMPISANICFLPPHLVQ